MKKLYFIYLIVPSLLFGLSVSAQNEVSLNEDEALVYIIRPKDLYYAEPFAIYSGQIHLGTFRIKTCYYFTFPQGKYLLRSPQASKKNREMEVEFEAGKTYYIEIAKNASMSFMDDKNKIDKYLKKYQTDNIREDLENGIVRYKQVK